MDEAIVLTKKTFIPIKIILGENEKAGDYQFYVNGEESLLATGITNGDIVNVPVLMNKPSRPEVKKICSAKKMLKSELKNGANYRVRVCSIARLAWIPG